MLKLSLINRGSLYRYTAISLYRYMAMGPRHRWEPSEFPEPSEKPEGPLAEGF